MTLLSCVVFVAYGSGGFERGTFYGVNRIEISGSLLDFEITGTIGGATEVITGQLASSVRLEVDQYGDRLVVRVERGFSLFRWGHSDPVEIRMPRNAEIDASTASGSISISGIDSDEIGVHSASGAIVAERLDGEIGLSTASGSISLTGGTGRLEVSSVSGKVSVVDFTGDSTIGTTSGSVDIDGFRGALDAVTVSGSIRAQGVEADDDCRFRTTSGRIDVEFENDESDLRFELASTSGSLRAFGARGQRSLAVGEGGLLVTGSSVSGSQEYR